MLAGFDSCYGARRAHGCPCKAGRAWLLPCLPTSRQQRCSLKASASLFSKLFGEPKEGSPQRRAPPEAFIMSENRAQPEFPPYAVVKRGPKYDLRLYDVYPIVEIEYNKREEGYAALGAYIAGAPRSWSSTRALPQLRLLAHLGFLLVPSKARSRTQMLPLHLARLISLIHQDGDNAGRVRFSYTQPVIMRYYSAEKKVMQMMLGTRQLPDGTILQPPRSAAEALSSLPSPSTNGRVSVSVAGGELVAVLRFDGYITPASAERARLTLLSALKSDGVQLAADEAAGFFRCAQYGAVYQLAGRVNELMLRVVP